MDASAKTSAAAKFDERAHSTKEAASLWVIANKKHPLNPVDYAPTDLVYPDLPNPNHQPMRGAAVETLEEFFRVGGGQPY